MMSSEDSQAVEVQDRQGLQAKVRSALSSARAKWCDEQL
jgi:hypothetical protein